MLQQELDRRQKIMTQIQEFKDEFKDEMTLTVSRTDSHSSIQSEPVAKSAAKLKKSSPL